MQSERVVAGQRAGRRLLESNDGAGKKRPSAGGQTMHSEVLQYPRACLVVSFLCLLDAGVVLTATFVAPSQRAQTQGVGRDHNQFRQR